MGDIVVAGEFASGIIVLNMKVAITLLSYSMCTFWYIRNRRELARYFLLGGMILVSGTMGSAVQMLNWLSCMVGWSSCLHLGLLS
jgi:hypothetical protein